jgi:hypothetical protein
MRLEMPAGYRIPPHFHQVDEHVTVVSGAFQVGMGEKFDEGKLTTLPPGTFGVIPHGREDEFDAEMQTTGWAALGCNGSRGGALVGMKATMYEAGQPAPKQRPTMPDTTIKTQGCSCGGGLTIESRLLAVSVVVPVVSMTVPSDRAPTVTVSPA